MQELRKDRHEILNDLNTELQKGFIEDTVEVHGRMWTLKTLNDGEESWSDKFVSSSNIAATLTTRRAPKLAVSIRAINDVPIEQLFFIPDDTDVDKAAKEFIMANPVRLRYWYAEKMYEFLEDQPAAFVDELYIKYEELCKRLREVNKQVKNSSKKTPIPA